MQSNSRYIVELCLLLNFTTSVCYGFSIGPSLINSLPTVKYGGKTSPLKASIAQEAMTSQDELSYNWKDQWYALTYADYVLNCSQTAEVVPAAVFGQPLVLWRNPEGTILCADDACPHRAAALSEGRMRDGKLECYYHGWQFDDNGSCTFVPQLATGASIPKAACLSMRDCRVVEGIVWVWMGEGEPTKKVPVQNDDLDALTGQREGFFVNDFQIDLPYDHSYLVENLLDPAHIDISHDRTPGGGKRERAEAYDMIVDKDSISPDGFKGRYRKESDAKRDGKDGPYIEVQYEAPGIIRQRGFPMGMNSTVYFGAALHCMPLGLGRSRLLFRAYFGGLPKFLMAIVSWKPEFLRNLNSCKVLEQDAGLITTQEDFFKRHPDRYLKDSFLLLQSSDLFVKSYRQWLDQVGHGMPWFQGLSKRSDNVDDHLTGYVAQPALNTVFHRAGNEMETRYHRHVVHCPATRNALKRVQKLKLITLATAAVSVTVAAAVATTTSQIAVKKAIVALLPFSCLASIVLHRLEQAFFVSFKRKEQMRTEKGV